MHTFNKSLLIFVAISVLDSRSSRQDAASQPEKELPAKSYKGTFGRVSNYLMEKVASNDPQTNMASVIERLESGKADDLEKVVLRKITTAAAVSGKCDRTSYLVLMDNDQITESGQHGLRFRIVPTKRIDQLFNFYCTQHAIKCQPIILNDFKEKYRTIEDVVKYRVSTWMDLVSELHLSGLKAHERTGQHVKQLFNNIILTKGHIKAATSVKPAYDAIVALSRQESNQIKQWDGTEVINLFKDLLLDSCNKYVKHLGPDVFEKANFDLSFHHEFETNEPEFYRAWSRYQLCTSFKLKFDWMWTFLNPSGELAKYAALQAGR